MNIILTFTLATGEKETIKKQNIMGILQDKILNFEVDGMHHELNMKNQLFIRENEEYKFTLNIENQTCNLELKKEGHQLNIVVDYATLIIENSNCQLEYLIETSDEKIKLDLTWEEKNDN